MLKAWIGIGSNLGDRAKNIAFAEQELRGILSEFTMSSVIESNAVGRDGNPSNDAPYLNAAACGSTKLDPFELLAALKRIELNAGRNPAEKGLYLPRPLDLDLLIVEEGGALLRIASPTLNLPHPRIAERPFVTTPLTELGFDIGRLNSDF